MGTPSSSEARTPAGSRRAAASVGAGVLLTRVLGLVRQRVFAHYFGNGVDADAFTAALKIPNVIRNLLGEGTLAASFIPVYARMIERDDDEAARRLSSAVASFLVLVAGGAALLGVVLAPAITDVIALGFTGAKRDLTITLVRILFPMSAVMVLSAWCLGVLNTHRRFFLSYAAPTFWNIAQIATLVAGGFVWVGAQLVTALAWGALAGAVIQLLVQLPTVLGLTGGVQWLPSLNVAGIRRVLSAWLPVVFGAGVMQISSIVDTQLGTLLAEGAVATLAYAQLIGILPISLFGISVAASALPELSREAAANASDAMRSRMADGAQRVLFFILPSAAVFMVAGRHVVAPLLQTGEFGPTQTMQVVAVLAALGLGLPAQALIKLVTSGHYALGDTRTPVRIAMLSVPLGAVLAFVLMQRYGVVGIALGGAIAAYLNVTLNLATLSRKIAGILGPAERRQILASAGAAVLAAAAAFGTDRLTAGGGLWTSAVLVLGAFSVVYLATTDLLGHPEARALRRRITRR